MTAPAHLQVPGLPSDQEHQQDPGSLEGGTDKVKLRWDQLGRPHLHLPCSPRLPGSPFCPAAPEIKDTVSAHPSFTSERLTRRDGGHLLSRALPSRP